MAKKGFRISKEIKEQIINRIKVDGTSVTQAATDAGISTGTIYKWLGSQATASVSALGSAILHRAPPKQKENTYSTRYDTNAICKKKQH